MPGSFSCGVAFTQLWLTLLVVTPVNGQHEAVLQSVVYLQPPWTTFFQGEKVTLFCYGFGFYLPQKTKWYRKNKTQRQLRSTSTLEVRESGEYWCQADNFLPSMHVHLDFRQDSLVLQAPPAVFEGDSVVLRCHTREDIAAESLKFYKNGKALELSGPSSELHIHHANREDNGQYTCTGRKNWHLKYTPSNTVRVQVQGALADFQTYIMPASKLVYEGQSLLLNCSVNGVPGPLKFSWYKRDMLNKKANIPKSSGAEVKISKVNVSDAGEYYCEAKNSRRRFVSRAVPITIKVPVSQPVLTLSSGKTQALEGDLMTLHCKSQRGSPYILYEFYHENVSLGNSSTLSGEGGGASFNFSMSTERSGNYHCTADNGLGAQNSEAIWISVAEMTNNRSAPVIAGITVGLLITAVGVFLSYCWFSRQAGGKPASDESRSPSDAEPQEPTYYNMPACIELQPVYSNDPKEAVIYTEIRRTQPKPKPKRAVKESESPRSRCQMAEKN